MNFKFKLSRRLAAAHSLLLTATLVAAGCNTNKALAPDIALVQLLILPQGVVLKPLDTQEYTALGITSTGDTAAVVVTWSATGGTITPDGLFWAGQSPGTYSVIATETGGTLADTAAVSITSPPATLDSVVLTPSTATLQSAQTQQFAAYGLLSTGDSVAVAVTYTATGGNITSAGLYTAGPTQGSYQAIATLTGGTLADTSAIAINAPPPPPGAVADPTLLPLAVPNQLPDYAAYVALDLPNQVSGFSYADPTTGVTVYKVSDANTPVPNPKVVHDYSEFGPHISMPWVDGATGHTMYTLHIFAGATEGYFLDFDYDAGTFSGWRLAPWDALEGGFSSNAATPQVGYRTSGGKFTRVNTATAMDENTGNFPSPVLPNMVWATQFLVDGNDEWLVVQGGLSAAPNDHGVAWNSVTGQLWDWGPNPPDEFKLDRDGEWVFLQHTTFAWEQASLASGPPATGIRTWIPDFALSHGATVKGYLVGIDPTVSGGRRLNYYDPVDHTRTWIGNAGQFAADHLAAQWVNGSPTGLEQWVLSSAYNGSSDQLLYEGIGFFQLNDASASNVRLLAHHYSTSDKSNYWSQPHATISPDGKLVMWGSEMNVPGGRIDVFLAKVPAQ